MPDISKIELPSGNIYTIKDEVARNALSVGPVFLGFTTTELTDGSTTTPITIDGESVDAVNAGIAIYGNKEFIYTTKDLKWHELGDTSGLGSLAYKSSASGSYTPEGSVSAPTITVEPSTVTKYVADSATGGGSVTAGSAASCTLPSLTMTVENETLAFSWSAGSFTANTPTAITLPSFSSQEIAVGISSASSSKPAFTGTAKNIIVS